MLLCMIVFLLCCFFFFFSSRRRHTRWTGDWSSDVCSSDLLMENFAARGFAYVRSGLGKGRRSTSANGHVSAFAGEFFRDGAAQSFAGSRDDRDAPRDPQIHSGTSSKLVIVSQNGRDRQWRVR